MIARKKLVLTTQTEVSLIQHSDTTGTGDGLSTTYTGRRCHAFHVVAVNPSLFVEYQPTVRVLLILALMSRSAECVFDGSSGA